MQNTTGAETAEVVVVAWCVAQAVVCAIGAAILACVPNHPTAQAADADDDPLVYARAV